MKESSGNKLIANNKKAYYDYFIDEKYEAGLVLHGTEVKSLRQGKCSIKEAYIQIINGEVFVINMNITPYEKGNIFNKDPLRTRKLLLSKKEILSFIFLINSSFDKFSSASQGKWQAIIAYSRMPADHMSALIPS